MARIGYMTPEAATGKTKDLYATLEKNLPRVFNVFQAMGNSPAVLNSYMEFSGSLGKGSHSPQLIEKIALHVAQKNDCQY